MHNNLPNPDSAGYKDILSRYLPAGSVEPVYDLLTGLNIYLTITRKRSTKLGDHTPPVYVKGHKITINHDLNRFEFLITLLHEIAHVKTWEKFKRKVRPHGIEWKSEFRGLLALFIEMNIFPGDVITAIDIAYFKRHTFSNSAIVELNDALRKYSDKPPALRVMDIPDNAVFAIKPGRLFVKMEKLRKRYKCKEIYSGKIYLVHPLAEVHGFEKL